MKPAKITLLTLAIGGLLAFHPAQAQEAKDSKAAPKDAPRRDASEVVKERLEKIATDLKLTDDQKKKVEEVMKKQVEQRGELRGLSDADRGEKIRAFREEADKKMKEILTKEQYEQWEKIRSTSGRPEGKKTEKKSDN